MTAIIYASTNLLFGLPKSRRFSFEDFPEGLLKHDFSHDDFARVHVYTPEGGLLTYVVNAEERDGEVVLTPAHLLQDLALSFDALEERVIEWGTVRGIIGKDGKATLLTQLDKTQSELDETVEAAVNYQDAVDTAALAASAGGEADVVNLRELHEEIVDGIGDQLVTLILAAQLAGVTTTHCLNHAYNEIKNRTGKMVDGQFVKDR